jgi:hypothetical protein
LAHVYVSIPAPVHSGCVRSETTVAGFGLFHKLHMPGNESIVLKLRKLLSSAVDGSEMRTNWLGRWMS